MRHPLSFGKYDGKGAPPITPAAMAQLHRDVAAAKGQKLSAAEEALLNRQAGISATSTTATVHSIKSTEPDLSEALAMMTGEPIPTTIKLGGVEYTRQTPKMKSIRALIPRLVQLWESRDKSKVAGDGSGLLLAALEGFANGNEHGCSIVGTIFADVYSLPFTGMEAFNWWDNLPCDEGTEALAGVAASIPFGRLVASFTSAAEAAGSSINSVTGGK